MNLNMNMSPVVDESPLAFFFPGGRAQTQFETSKSQLRGAKRQFVMLPSASPLQVGQES